MSKNIAVRICYATVLAISLLGVKPALAGKNEHCNPVDIKPVSSYCHVQGTADLAIINNYIWDGTSYYYACVPKNNDYCVQDQVQVGTQELITVEKFTQYQCFPENGRVTASPDTAVSNKRSFHWMIDDCDDTPGTPV